MGRPKKENPKCKQIRIRMTDDEYRLLESLAKAAGMTKTSILISGLYCVYDGLSEEEAYRFWDIEKEE